MRYDKSAPSASRFASLPRTQSLKPSLPPGVTCELTMVQEYRFWLPVLSGNQLRATYNERVRVQIWTLMPSPKGSHKKASSSLFNTHITHIAIEPDLWAGSQREHGLNGRTQ